MYHSWLILLSFHLLTISSCRNLNFMALKKKWIFILLRIIGKHLVSLLFHYRLVAFVLWLFNSNKSWYGTLSAYFCELPLAFRICIFPVKHGKFLVIKYTNCTFLFHSPLSWTPNPCVSGMTFGMKICWHEKMRSISETYFFHFFIIFSNSSLH